MSQISPLDIIKEEFNDYEKSETWNHIYQKIRIEGNYDLSCSAALLPQNRNQNRYKDVLPYDHSRIILEGCSTDYINASLLEVKEINRQYVLSQGPLAHTTPYFWLLIWQQKTKGIIMLNRIMEKNQIKCHQYWPLGEKRGGQNIIEFPTVDLKVELQKEAHHSHYIYRTFRLSCLSTNESREVLHFHYTTWSDFGVPQSPDAFYKFLNVVRSSQCLEPKFGPAVIHCSAGIGRSGTFCLVDSILLMLDRDLCPINKGSVVNLLLEMRRYRMGLIQTSDQLRFSFQAILYGAQIKDETNGKDPSEDSGSGDDLSTEEPPPLPPPRTDSLARSTIVNATTADDVTRTLSDDVSDVEDSDDDDTSLDEDDGDDPLGLSRDTSLPNLSSTPLLSDQSPDSYNSESNHSQSRTFELRQRRMDRMATTSAKVAAIKERAKVAEKWEEQKQALLGPLSVCTVVALVGIAAGGILYYYRQFN